MSKAYKRMAVYKGSSAANKAGWGVPSDVKRKIKNQQRKLLRLIQKDLLRLNN